MTNEEAIKLAKRMLVAHKSSRPLREASAVRLLKHLASLKEELPAPKKVVDYFRTTHFKQFVEIRDVDQDFMLTFGMSNNRKIVKIRTNLLSLSEIKKALNNALAAKKDIYE